MKYKIDSIRDLFYKNTSNVIVLRNIMHELLFRKTDKAKTLIKDIRDHINRTFGVKSNVLKSIEAGLRGVKIKKPKLKKKLAIANLESISSIEESISVQRMQLNDKVIGSNIKLRNPIKIQDKTEGILQELLSCMTLKEFVKNNPVPVRVRNSILAVNDNFIEFDSVYDFISSSKENQQHLSRLPNFGKKSLNDLISAIEEFIKQIESGSSNNFIIEPIDQSSSNQANILSNHIDKALKNNLSAIQTSSLKNIPLSTFVMSFNGISTRTKNAILKADKKGLCEYQNLFEFYIATDSYKENLLNLDDFGRGSLKNLIQCVDDIVNSKELLTSMSERCARSSNVSMFSSIKEIIDYAVSILDKGSEQEIVRLRRLRQNTLTLQEIGDRIGVTRERVRQIDAKAIEKIGRFILGFSQEDLDLNFKLR